MKIEKGKGYAYRGVKNEYFTPGRIYTINSYRPDAQFSGNQIIVIDDRDGKHGWSREHFELNFCDQVEVYERVDKPTARHQVLEAAIKTVADRGVPYGGVEDNFGRIARLWNGHIMNRYASAAGGDVPTFIPSLDASDVAMMMALMKIARLENCPTHADSWIDIAGYAACGGEIAAKKTA